MIGRGRCVVLSLTLILVSCTTATIADDVSRPRVAYAGFALVGATADLPRLYPVTHSIQDKVNAALYERVRDVTPEHYDLVASSLLQSDKGNSLALAFALEFEQISVERIAGSYKAVVELSAQALVFDFDGDERAIVASYPVQLSPYADLFDQRPSQAQLSAMVQQYLLAGFNEEGSYIDRFIDIIRSAPIRPKYAREIGIGEILFDDEMKAAIPPAQREKLPALAHQIGRRMASALARQQQVSVIPYQLDTSVATLAMRFTGERSATFLKLPTPDYVVDMALLGVSRNVYSSSNVGKAYLYGAYAQLRLRETFGGQQDVFNQYIQHAVTKEVPAIQDEIDHWAASLDSVWGLLAAMSGELGKPSREWIRANELTRADRKEYQSFKEVLDQCK